jgi:hypothetical protein
MPRNQPTLFRLDLGSHQDAAREPSRRPGLASMVLSQAHQRKRALRDTLRPLRKPRRSPGGRSQSGIVGLGDRAEAAGGTLTVTSPPGRGTVVTATIPLDRG